MSKVYPNTRCEVSATTDGKVAVRVYDGEDRLVFKATMTREQAQAFARELLDAVRMLDGAP